MWHSAECHFVVCHAEFHFAKCHNAECLSNERNSAKCHFAECQLLNVTMSPCRLSLCWVSFCRMSWRQAKLIVCFAPHLFSQEILCFFAKIYFMSKFKISIILLAFGYYLFLLICCLSTEHKISKQLNCFHLSFPSFVFFPKFSKFFEKFLSVFTQFPFHFLS